MTITWTVYIKLNETILVERDSGEYLVERASGESLVVRGDPTDVTLDVFQDWEWEKGIRGKGPQDRVASSGALHLTLNNDWSNLAGLKGAYSPDHANCRPGWGIGSQIILEEYDGTTTKVTLWRATEIAPGAGKYRDSKVQVTAEDYISIMSRQNIEGLAAQVNRRGDEVLSYVLSSLPLTPKAISLGTSDYTFPYSLDATERDESTTVYSIINKVCLSDLGYFYETPDATDGSTLKYESPTERAAKSSSATFSNTMKDIQVRRAMERVYNDVRVTTYPRKLDTSDVDLAKLDSELELTAGQSVTINLRYVDQSSSARVAKLSTIYPVATTDYKMSSVEEDGGSDLNSSLGIALNTSSANSANVTLTNNHGSSTGYVNLFKIRGRAIRTDNPVVSLASDSASQMDFGKRVLRYDMPYQSNPNVGQTVANSLKAEYKDPKSDVDGLIYVAHDTTLEGHAVGRNIGDKIMLTEDLTGVSADVFFIQSEKHALVDNLIQVEYGLVPV